MSAVDEAWDGHPSLNVRQTLWWKWCIQDGSLVIVDRNGNALLWPKTLEMARVLCAAVNSFGAYRDSAGEARMFLSEMLSKNGFTDTDDQRRASTILKHLQEARAEEDTVP